MDDMIQWCLVCERKLPHDGLYCSIECLRVDYGFAKSSPLSASNSIFVPNNPIASRNGVDVLAFIEKHSKPVSTLRPSYPSQTCLSQLHRVDSDESIDLPKLGSPTMSVQSFGSTSSVEPVINIGSSLNGANGLKGIAGSKAFGLEFRSRRTTGWGLRH